MIVVIAAMMLVDLHICAEEPELNKARCTAYVLKGTMANGEQVRKGACAFKRELIGKTIIVYLRHPDGSIGSMVGVYECLDHCPTEHVIDIWAEDMEHAQEIMNKVYEEDAQGRIFYQVIDAKG